jgi:hypothetical protein
MVSVSAKAKPPPPAYGSMLPSPGSTDRSSLENLLGVTSKNGDGGDLESSHLLIDQQSSSEIQRHNFLRCTGSKLDGESCDNLKGRNVRLYSLVLLGIVVVVAGLIGFFTNHHSAIDMPFAHNDKQLQFTGPFSTLDPVADLGLPKFHRPATSRPPLPLTLGQPDARHFPTNSWYQNLLMPRDETHRAYSIPYVVDCAGPIPGLRVHPNHVDASSFVVQLNVITQYGLTLGATADAGSTATSSSTHHDDTHMYKVTHTTPLGVTLEWVR